MYMYIIMACAECTWSLRAAIYLPSFVCEGLPVQQLYSRTPRRIRNREVIYNVQYMPPRIHATMSCIDHNKDPVYLCRMVSMLPTLECNSSQCYWLLSVYIHVEGWLAFIYTLTFCCCWRVSSYSYIGIKFQCVKQSAETEHVMCNDHSKLNVCYQLAGVTRANIELPMIHQVRNLNKLSTITVTFLCCWRVSWSLLDLWTMEVSSSFSLTSYS